MTIVSAQEKEVSMLTAPVPDFFQEESEAALRSRIEWLERQLPLGDAFFARCLGMEVGGFRAWQKGQSLLSVEQQATARDFWRVFLHLFSFMNHDAQRVQGLLEHRVSEEATAGTFPFAPPWRGSSLRAYLQELGPSALPQVDRWVTSFRFGNPYVA